MHLSKKRFNQKSIYNAQKRYAIKILFCFFLLIFTTFTAHSAPNSAKSKKNHTIVILGDSISAAYGVPTESGWVSLLQQKLKHENKSHTVVNASISGETTKGGIERLPAIIKRHQPSILIIELGGNDGLRGFPLNLIKDNLQTLVDQAKDNNITPILVAMRIPPNYGRRYTSGFYNIFEQVAQENNIALVPFLLEEVALNTELMQADGIHPTALAQPILLEHIWESLTTLL